MAIRRLCNCGAIALPGKRTCEQHTRKQKARPSAHTRGYDAQHRKDRKRYLAHHPTCEDPYGEGCTQPATVLDHIDGFGPLGPAGHDETNWMALCASCHGRKTAEQTPGGWNAVPPPSGCTSPFLLLVGLSGTGKTTVRDELCERFDADGLGPDDYEDGWSGLWHRLDATERAIVECVRVHRGLRDRARHRNARLVELTADRWVRRERLRARGDGERTVTQLLKDHAGYAYGAEDQLPLALTVSTDTGSPGDAVETIAEWVRDALGWG